MERTRKRRLSVPSSLSEVSVEDGTRRKRSTRPACSSAAVISCLLLLLLALLVALAGGHYLTHAAFRECHFRARRNEKREQFRIKADDGVCGTSHLRVGSACIRFYAVHGTARARFTPTNVCFVVHAV